MIYPAVANILRQIYNWNMDISFVNETARNIHVSSLIEVADLFRDTGADLSIRVTALGGDPAAAVAECCGYDTVRSEADAVQYAVKKAVFEMLSSVTGSHPAWGSLTGVKPLKIMVQLKEKGFDAESIRQYFRRNFLISGAKLALLESCVDTHMKLLYPHGDDYALYVHIPLCLSKCSYCSFPSAVTSEGSDLCGEYLSALIKELRAVCGYFPSRKADCAYVGGGTPSILSSEQSSRLLEEIGVLCRDLKELTFEAGRADTLEREKLEALRRSGVTRISLNPQTTDNATLERIGRRVTHEMFLKTFGEARSAGHDNINCDIIYGLEDEREESCFRSLSDIMDLSPESITLHTLCKKRTSAIEGESLLKKELPVAGMMDTSRLMLAERGYMPYYLYRQKNAVDNAENTGYALAGAENIYNIRMMGERQSVISAGAGSTTKIYFPGEDRFENIYNIKNIRLYIDTIDQVIEKKLRTLDRVLSGGRQEQ